MQPSEGMLGDMSPSLRMCKMLLMVLTENIKVQTKTRSAASSRIYSKSMTTSLPMQILKQLNNYKATDLISVEGGQPCVQILRLLTTEMKAVAGGDWATGES